MRKHITCSNCRHKWDQDLAETLLRIACPQCGVVLDLIRAAEARPELTQNDQALVGFAGGIVLGLLLLTIFGTTGKRR